MRWTGLIVLLEFSPHATDFFALGRAGVVGAAALAGAFPAPPSDRTTLAVGTRSDARWIGND